MRPARRRGPASLGARSPTPSSTRRSARSDGSLTMRRPARRSPGARRPFLDARQARTPTAPPSRNWLRDPRGPDQLLARDRWAELSRTVRSAPARRQRILGGPVMRCPPPPCAHAVRGPVNAPPRRGCAALGADRRGRRARTARPPRRGQRGRGPARTARRGTDRRGPATVAERRFSRGQRTPHVVATDTRDDDLWRPRNGSRRARTQKLASRPRGCFANRWTTSSRASHRLCSADLPDAAHRGCPEPPIADLG